MPTQPNQQVGSNQFIASDGTPLDPTVVTLAKAIREQEGGDFNAIGDNGKSHGAYQFYGDNFQEWAKQYGLNPADTSPINQDKVAYARIKDLLSRGNSLSEIAARWNGARVENGKYVPLNPKYVEGVKNKYQQISNNSTNQYVNPNVSKQNNNQFVIPPQVSDIQSPPISKTQETKQPGFLQSLVQGIANPFLQVGRLPVGLAEQGIGNLIGNETLKKSGQLLASSQAINDPFFGNISQLGYDQGGKSLSTGGQVAQGIGVGAQIAPYFMGAGEAQSLIKNAGEKTVLGLAKTGLKTGATLGGIVGAGQGLQRGIETSQPNSEVAAQTIFGGLGGAAVGGVVGGATGLAGGLLGKTLGKVNVNAKVNDAIDSINPNLSGKKLAGTYERAALRGGIGEQGAQIDPQIQKLGTSLSDIGLNPANPRGNLIKLGQAMEQTESKITPFENYSTSPGIKRVLVNELENIKTQTPREFQGIKESKTLFNSVVDFAKEVVNSADNTIGGFRSARTAFDAQTKLEFPGAYHEGGFINIKTPAGQAIRLVRDALNENLYKIAPTNSGIDSLIAREADIYRAIHNVAPKAAKLNGLTATEAFLKRNPTLNKILQVGKYIIPAGFAGGLIEHYANP